MAFDKNSSPVYVSDSFSAIQGSLCAIQILNIDGLEIIRKPTIFWLLSIIKLFHLNNVCEEWCLSVKSVCIKHPFCVCSTEMSCSVCREAGRFWLTFLQGCLSTAPFTSFSKVPTSDISQQESGVATPAGQWFQVDP